MALQRFIFIINTPVSFEAVFRDVTQGSGGLRDIPKMAAKETINTPVVF